MSGDKFPSGALPMRRRGLRVVAAVAAALVATAGFSAAPDVPAGSNAKQPEPAYIEEITKRADKIVAPLDLADEQKRARVRDLIAGQYQTIREIHAVRNARIAETKRVPGDAALAEGYAKAARDAASLQLVEAHRRFVARLAVELTPEQVDSVKDGLTYGVVGITYKRYLELFPNLRDQEKREILANLLEARELAMDGGSSEEKHAVFGKYKGRINNYLSKAGYDMKQAEKDLAKKQKAASQK